MENRRGPNILLVFLLLATIGLPEPGSPASPHPRQHSRPTVGQSGETRHRDRPSHPGSPGRFQHPPHAPRNRHPGREPTRQRPFHRRPPRTIPRQWYVPWVDLDSGMESSRSQYEEMMEKASSLADRVRALDEKYRVQNLFLSQARTYAQEMRANRDNPDFIVPEDLVAFLLDHDMMLPSPNQDGVYGPAEFAGMLSLLEDTMARLTKEIDTTILRRDDALRQYNATIDILLRRYQRVPPT